MSRRVNHEDFISKLILNNTYYREGSFSIIGEYTQRRDKILVCNRYGECLVSVASLLEGYNISIRSATDKNSYAKEVFKHIHGDLYNYDKFIFHSAKTPSSIVCKIHGEFKQTYDVHRKGHGCMKCHTEKITKKKETFIKEASKLHNNEFNYEKVNYKNTGSKIEILCKKHGSFLQTPNSHLSGKKCPECYRELKGWSKSAFIEYCRVKNRLPTFYFIKVFDDTESFYKIGITSNTIEKRFKSKHEMPYKYKVIYSVVSDAENVWNLEQKAKKYIRRFKYKPLIHFDGEQECFKKIDFLEFYELISKTNE